MPPLKLIKMAPGATGLGAIPRAPSSRARQSVSAGCHVVIAECSARWGARAPVFLGSFSIGRTERTNVYHRICCRNFRAEDVNAAHIERRGRVTVVEFSDPGRRALANAREKNLCPAWN